MVDADNFDDLDLEGDGEGQIGGEGEGGGGLKRVFSGSLVRILLYVAAAIIVVMISVISARCVAGSASQKAGYDKDRQILKEKKKPLATFNLKQFMGNTADTDVPHLVRIKLQIGYEKRNLKLQTELNDRRAQLRDLILFFFKGRKKEEMDTKQEVEELKKSLVNQINRIMQNGEIEAIYFEEFTVN